MADLTRIASNVCIYWETQSDNPDLIDAGLQGRCTAGERFPTSRITCYNDGNCNGSGTCHDCTGYDVGGLQYSHKETTHVYSVSYLLEWNKELNRYVPVRQLSQEESSSEEAMSASLTWFQKTTSLNVSGEQRPFNLSIYNLRAKFQKCCNWSGSPFDYHKNKNGTLTGKEYNVVPTGRAGFTISVRDIPYLSKTPAGVYTGAKLLTRHCEVVAADPWKVPFTEENPYAYGCNGAKPECPYYTGPTWSECVDSKMERGDRISAKQVMELRFYSDDWSQFSWPEDTFRKRFKDPEIYAWTGKFEFGGDTATVGEDGLPNDNPLVQKVYISDFSGSTPVITADPPEPATKGLRVFGNIPESTQTYPTAIRDIVGTVSGQIKIAFPRHTSEDSPYEFRTFRIGQNTIRIYVESSLLSNLYLVNLTKHPQHSSSNAEHVQYMLENYPNDIVSITGLGIAGSVIWGDVELEHSEELNVIRAYTLDPSSPTLTFLSATCYVKHRMYHAHIMQTLGRDESGHPRLNPWIERFERAYCEAEVVPLGNTPKIHDVLWDSDAGGKLSMYPTEEVHYNQIIENWYPLGCSVALLEYTDLKCNSIYPWSTFGKSPRGVELSLELIRTNNEAAATDGIDGRVPLKLLFQSYTGSHLPGNTIVVLPDLAVRDANGKAIPGLSLPWSGGFDPQKDIILSTYYTTGYKQAPLEPGDNLKLKYPKAVNYYMDELPLEMKLEGSKFSVRGSSLCISLQDKKQNIDVQERIYDISGVKEQVYNGLLSEETKAIDSFQKGGVNDGSLRTSTQIFESARDYFESQYSGYKFCRDGIPVTLHNLCQRLSELKKHEGDYTFLFVFSDEDGRPIGTKRVSMLLQSAVVETRDVEIYYEWRMKLLAWPIVDSLLLLGRHSKPLAPAGGYEGSETYRPRCGDHSEEFLTNHFFGDPGPMWYPYMACNEPRYHEDGWNFVVKCKNYVEGFVYGNNVGDLEGKRWSYWERMRGNDMLTTHVAGPIFLIGCFYREVSYSYQLTDEQKFTGYTRIRSGHPHGPFSKDREAIRASRHFVKRNLKVRNEVVAAEDAKLELGWTDEYEQIIFTDPNDKSKGIIVGNQQETPIWVHLIDSVSIVNRTTDLRQHPFSHYLLKSVGSHNFSETFDESEDNRLKLSEVLEDRDLTSIQSRRSDGTLIYTPGEPQYMDEYQNYNDIIPVYKDPTIAWGWLERPKELVRQESSPIGGVAIHNPTVNVWKTDRESAVYTDEGVNFLAYTAPVFDKDTGAITKLPSLSWAGGPPRYIDWYSGQWVEDVPQYGLTSIYSSNAKKENFQFFGRTTDGSSFLMDKSGTQKYVHTVTNKGVEYRYTSRGIGVTVPISTDLLPYERADLVNDITGLYLKTTKLNEKFSTLRPTVFDTGVFGQYYIESIDITYKFGPGTEQAENGQLFSVRYDVPKVNLYVSRTPAFLAGTQTFLISSSDYKRTTTGVVYDTEPNDDGLAFAYNDAGYSKISYKVGSFASRLQLQFEAVRADARAYIEEIVINYRRPVDRVEGVHNFEQKVNVSRGNTGFPDYRKMLYYYSRTLVDYNDGLGYNLLENNGQVSTAPGLNSVKFTSRSVRDVILEYEYFDPSGSRFPYNSKVHPNKSSIAQPDDEGYLTVPGSIEICTKSRTLYAAGHVNDNPQWVLSGNRTVENKKSVAVNENSFCSRNVGPEKLGEQVQECLYDRARYMLGGDVYTVMTWFWHPDEVAFWENTMNTYLPRDKQLILDSKISPFSRVFQHEHFACTSELSTPMSDGHLHQIPPWRALGHRVYTGRPMFNYACYDVVIHKIEEHIGEMTYGTSKYGQNASSGGATWPWEAPRDREHYLQRGLIETSGYIGGAIGGAGPGFWAAQSQLSHGFTAPQQDIAREVDEQVLAGREDAVRADASRKHAHSDSPPVGTGTKEFV